MEAGVVVLLLETAVMTVARMRGRSLPGCMDGRVGSRNRYRGVCWVGRSTFFCSF